MKNKFFNKGAILIGIIIFLIIVQILLKILVPCKWLKAVWSVGDFITFCGTIGLGIIACLQTQKANEMSQNLMQIEEDRDRLEICPFFMVTEWEMYYIPKEDTLNDKQRVSIQIGELDNEIVGLALNIQNTTKSFITLEYLRGQTETGLKWDNAGQNQLNRKLLLKEGEEGKINFYASKDFMKRLEGERCELQFILENRFAQRYQEKFILIISHINQNMSCSCHIQEYEIKRCNMQKEEKKSKKDKLKKYISRKINKLLRRKGIIRFAKKYIFLSVMFGIAVIISIIYDWKFLNNNKSIYKPELFMSK